MQNTIFLPYLFSPNRDPCVTISSVVGMDMLAYFTLVSLVFLEISISILYSNFTLVYRIYVCIWHSIYITVSLIVLVRFIYLV